MSSSSSAVFRLASTVLAVSLPLLASSLTTPPTTNPPTTSTPAPPPPTTMTTTHSATNGHASKPYTVEDHDVATPSNPVPITYTQLYINGQWVDGKNGKTLDVINPTTGKKVATVAEADEADVDIAVKAARAAYTSTWSKAVRRTPAPS